MDTNINTIRSVIGIAVAALPGDRAVILDALQLSLAVGDQVASTLVGEPLNAGELSAARRQILQQKLTEAQRLVEQERERMRLGFADARKALQDAERLLQSIQSGRWRPVQHVTVNVGDLKRALQQILQSPTASINVPVPEPADFETS